MSNKNERNIIVNEFYEANKPDFMDKKRLAEELSCSVDYIESLMRKGEFIEEVHYYRKERMIRFYYPAVREFLVPMRYCKD